MPLFLQNYYNQHILIENRFPLTCVDAYKHTKEFWYQNLPNDYYNIIATYRSFHLRAVTVRIHACTFNVQCRKESKTTYTHAVAHMDCL